MKHLHLALSWRTKIIKSIRHSAGHAACGIIAAPAHGYAI
jgi:hypothetical protein